MTLAGRSRWILAFCLSLLVLPSTLGRREGGKGAGDNEVVLTQGGYRTRQVRPGHVELHALAGRPLHVRAGKKSQLLKRAGVDKTATLRESKGSGGTKKPAITQYLVRIVSPVSPMLTGIADHLAELAGGRFFRYLPYDTFVMALPQAGLEKVRKAAGVTDVFELPESMKIDPSLIKHITGAHVEDLTSPTHHDEFLSLVGVKRRAMPKSSAQGGSADLRRAKGKEGTDTRVVYVMLAYGGPEWALEVEALMAEWKQAFVKMGITASVELASERKAVVKVVGATSLKKNLAWLARQPLVHWVQEQKEVSLRNKDAGLAMQSWNASTHDIWAHGIRGAGQIVGVADTGIDFDNCFFRDKAMPTPPRFVYFVCRAVKPSAAARRSFRTSPSLVAQREGLTPFLPRAPRLV